MSITIRIGNIFKLSLVESISHHIQELNISLCASAHLLTTVKNRQCSAGDQWSPLRNGWWNHPLQIPCQSGGLLLARARPSETSIFSLWGENATKSGRYLLHKIEIATKSGWYLRWFRRLPCRFAPRYDTGVRMVHQKWPLSTKNPESDWVRIFVYVLPILKIQK